MSTITLSWTTEKRKVSELIPADYNPRVMSDVERDNLLQSIKEFDQVVPVVINIDNKLIGGHQRCIIYSDLGIEEIEVRIPNRMLTEEEEQRLNIRLNKNTGAWDYGKLKDFDFDMLLEVGFDEELLNMELKLDDASLKEVEESRMVVLSVLPPESCTLQERVAIRIEDKNDYDRVKRAVADGKIGAKDIISLL